MGTENSSLVAKDQEAMEEARTRHVRPSLNFKILHPEELKESTQGKNEEHHSCYNASGHYLSTHLFLFGYLPEHGLLASPFPVTPISVFTQEPQVLSSHPPPCASYEKFLAGTSGAHDRRTKSAIMLPAMAQEFSK